MKNNNITNIVLEGTDGVGKTSLVYPLYHRLNYKYVVYDRGELSNYVYAKKFNRQFSGTQFGMPMLYVLLTCDPIELAERITHRAKTKQEQEELEHELSKIPEQQLYIDAAKLMKQDFHIITVDTSKLTLDETLNVLEKAILKYIDSLSYDNELSYNHFNRMYHDACKLLNLKFNVRGLQPYINDEKVMTDTKLNNGLFETYTDKRMPLNFIYSLAYTMTSKNVNINRQFDFVYPIGSKLLHRPETYDYILAMINGGHSLLTSDNPLIPVHPNIVKMNKSYRDEYIAELSKARATVYTSRDLAYLKMQTARLYESILANQIVFVDIDTDPDKEIVTQMFSNYVEKNSIKVLCDLLYVTPSTLSEHFNIVMSNEHIAKFIIRTQRRWYDELRTQLITKGEISCTQSK